MKIKDKKPNALIVIGLISLKWALALILVAMLTGGFNQPPAKQSTADHMVGVGVIR